MQTGQFSSPYSHALDAYWPGLLVRVIILSFCVSHAHTQSMVGELSQAERTLIKPYSIWRTLGVLPEMYNIVEGKPVENHEAYHLRPGVLTVTMVMM